MPAPQDLHLTAMKKYNRNEFLKLAGIGIPTAVYGIETKGIFYPERGAAQPWRLAVASYTFHNFSLDETIKMTLRLGLSAISLKSMHMPLESSAAELQQISGRSGQQALISMERE
jgi:hypothetical protein